MYKNLERFSPYLSNNTFNTRNDDIFNPPFQRLDICQRQSIKFQAPKNWNEIPEFIRNSNRLQLFKSSYKRYLVSRYQI